MSDVLSRRCALVLLAAMAAALATGLLAWGPVPLGAGAFAHADGRAALGLPNVVNVLASLPLFAAGLWGLRATRASTWPRQLRHAWGAFHCCAMGAALLAAIHHLNPTLATWLPAATAMSAGFAMLAAGALAERVDPRLASTSALAGIGLAVLLAAAWVGWSGAGDVRVFLLIELLPVLLLPAGAFSLHGAHTRPADWVLMLAGYGAARAADLADAPIFAATGWIGGHALMHLLLAGVTAWLAYAAARTSGAVVGAGASQRQASLNTAG